MIKVSVNQIPARFRQGKKRSAYVSVTDSVQIHSDAGLWSGGSRDHYFLLDTINGGLRAAVSWMSAAPFGDVRPREGARIALSKGTAIVRVGTFCGKESVPHYYVSQDDQNMFGLMGADPVAKPI